MQLQKTSRKINTLNEKHLHEALKLWYAQPGDRIEVEVDGSVIDIVRGDLLIEIQTRHFGAIKRKLEKLVAHHRLRLVYPIPSEKWIVRLAGNGKLAGRRKSPKKDSYESIFNELVSIPKLLMHSNFSIELLLIQEEEVRVYDGVRGWRRQGWVTNERRLLKVVGQRRLETPADLCAFIPADLALPFTTADLAATLARPLWVAQRMVYCLRLMGCVVQVGKRSKSILYTRSNP